VSSNGTPIAVGEPEFPLMATMATGAWLAPGNRVEVLLNGDATYPRLWEDLRSAQQSITLQLYYGAPGRMADTLGHILIERAKAGVRVLVLYDAFGTVDIPPSNRDAPSSRHRCRAVPANPVLHAPSRTESLARSGHRHRQSCRMDRRLRHRRQMVWRWTDKWVLAGD
jgi:phosphatidylserine/phosphatidylglycerophosphate/cardiolipin synthase-like enzyme